VKGQEQIIVKTPFKPSKMPWLSKVEAKELSSALKETWSEPYAIRAKWVALQAPEQHELYDKYVTAVRNTFNKMATISASMGSAIGRRKKAIHAAVTQAGTAPKGKKEKANPFAWAAAFWKLELQKLNNPMKNLFNPTTYLGIEFQDEVSTIERVMKEEQEPSMALLDELDNASEERKCLIKIFRLWLDKFSPNLKESKIVSVDEIADDNVFRKLDETSS